MRASRPLYPGYPFKPRVHVLALDDNWSLTVQTETVTLDLPSATYDEWKRSASELALDVRVDSVLGWRYFRDAIRDPQATINAARSSIDHHPRVVSIRWRVGNDYCMLFSAASWEDGATADAVETHRQTCDYLGVGTYPTPAALGSATMREKLDKSYTTLGEAVTTDLLDHLTGGRAELPAPVVAERAYEIDRRMAYVAEAAKPLPVGAATFLDDALLSECNEYPTWFGRCWVLILEPLALGAFALRDDRGALSYPTQPGRYVVWLWKDEAADATSAGCLISPERVWAWSRMDPVLSGWAHWIYEKRMGAPTEQVAEYIKRAAVAAIGVHAMRPGRLVVECATAENASADLIVNSEGFPTDYAVRIVFDDVPRQMVHWASYVWMQARRTLYLRELDEIAAGNVILASDFDSLVLAQPSPGCLATQLGAWRERALTNVRISAARWLECDEQTKTPGVPHPRGSLVGAAV